MDKGQALAVFEGTLAATSSERLRAARFLARIATNTDLSRISRIRETERNSWVRKALDQALRLSEAKCSAASVALDVEVGETPLDTHLHEELRAQATEETTAMFLHELRPIVGFLDAAANSEIDRYACSETKTFVVRIQAYFYALERLHKASTVPVIQEFGLTDLVVRVAEYEALQGRATLNDPNEEADEATGLEGDANLVPRPTAVRLAPVRRDPVITTGDPILVEMVLANALRNAIEAVSEVQEGGQREVILNWGVTNTDSWIAVLDEGGGLPQGWDRLTKLGSTTKSKGEGHLGMGLPIAQRAIQSLRGSFELTSRSDGGVSCMIRWPHEEIV